ncbi:hypothetical protein [Streptomyces sp. DH12]|uniref:hypothetical protein n=1 Tax=Streptomyces sp. DH12 TaxID=2857010 RepID=UPI001E5F7DFF|nr:hypothetical protein [Streptomyces sp. DH12]
MESPGTQTPLAGAVQDLASQVVSALRGGDHPAVFAGTAAAATSDEDLLLAAVRVLGPDALLPGALGLRPPHPDDLALFEKAVIAFPPAPDASLTSRWTHWGMTRALRGQSTAAVVPQDDEPDTGWVDTLPWQALTHQLALLAGLAVPLPAAPSSPAVSSASASAPTAESALVRAAGRRTVDIARGFVRAVRRRGWLQAAGAGRWLSVLDDVPDTLGLDTGLEFVAAMSGDDPRVALHLHAARHGLARSRGSAG